MMLPPAIKILVDPAVDISEFLESRLLLPDLSFEDIKGDMYQGIHVHYRSHECVLAEVLFDGDYLEQISFDYDVDDCMAAWYEYTLRSTTVDLMCILLFEAAYRSEEMIEEYKDRVIDVLIRDGVEREDLFVFKEFRTDSSDFLGFVDRIRTALKT